MLLVQARKLLHKLAAHVLLNLVGTLDPTRPPRLPPVFMVPSLLTELLETGIVVFHGRRLI